MPDQSDGRAALPYSSKGVVESDNYSASRLADFSPRDRPWDVHRAEADRVRDLYRGTEYARYAKRIHKCSGLLEFATLAEALSDKRLTLKRAQFCRVRHCPVCQWRRSLMWIARFLKALPRIRKDYPTARFIFLTLTVQNCELPELREKLTWMNKSWQRLIQRKAWPGIGFARSTEVTRVWDCFDGGNYLGRHGTKWIETWQRVNKKALRLESTLGCHPHFHALVMVPAGYFKSGSYLSQASWTDLWGESLQVNYRPVVHVQAVKPKKGDLPALDGSEVDAAIENAIRETFKYAVKAEDIIGDGGEDDAEWLINLTTALANTRAVALGGVFKNYMSEAEPENLVSEEEASLDDADTRLFFGWREWAKHYERIDSKRKSIDE